jgi:Lon protease-like protein
MKLLIAVVVGLLGLCSGWVPSQGQLCHQVRYLYDASICSTWTCPRRRRPRRRITVHDVLRSVSSATACLAAVDDGDIPTTNDDDDDDTLLSSLRSRMKQINDRATKLPIVVIDTMLPRQVLAIETSDPVFCQLLQTTLLPTTDGSTFGMVGIQRSTLGQAVFMKRGVEVTVVGKPERTDPNTVRVRLRGGRRFELAGELATAKQGWTEARVSFLDSKQEEQEEEAGEKPIALAQAMMKGRELKRGIDDGASLIDRWIELAKQNERQPGQIDRLVQELGEIPHSTTPSELSFWVGALINPLPAMGVALEIRPALLMAKTANDRMEVALHGIRTSIKHMDGTERLW